MMSSSLSVRDAAPTAGEYLWISFKSAVYIGFRGDSAFLKYWEDVADKTALPVECLWTVYLAAKQCLHVEGDFWECGVDRGGSAKFIAMTIAGRGKALHLFDTFSGMPAARSDIDWHKEGDFSTVDIADAAAFVGGDDTSFHKGLIPATFAGMESSRIAFAHVDLDIYQSTLDACAFIYPRLSRGAMMVLDDYGRPSCKGVRQAVDEFFGDKPERPIPNLTSAQALVFKL